MRFTYHQAVVICMVAGLVPIWGCRGRVSTATNETGTAHPDPKVSRASQELTGRLSTLINEANTRFQPLDYEYDEDLLRILDRFEDHQSGKAPGPFPRAMPLLDEQEEQAHLAETIRRWQATTRKDLRTEIDTLKAELAALKPGASASRTEFHRHFSATFDDLIPIEVAEIRERRNRDLHEKARPVFDEYRVRCPDVVREQEAFLDQPPYNPPSRIAPPGTHE